MSEPICTCHCGGSMFYRHLHADSCELSRVGEEAPKSELDQLRDEIERLRGALEQARDLIRHSMLFRGYLDGPLSEPWARHVLENAQAALTPQAGKGGGE